MHSLEIVGQLTFSNLVCSDGFQVKIGLSGQDESMLNELLKAPEMYASKESDIWALGVITFILLSGTLPFEAGSIEELQTNIRNFNINF